MSSDHPFRPGQSITGLREADLAADPIHQFAAWLERVLEAKLPEPNAMTLATSTPDGVPSARIVLLKGYDPDGFLFFTNYESQKGREFAANPRGGTLLVLANPGAPDPGGRDSVEGEPGRIGGLLSQPPGWQPGGRLGIPAKPGPA